MRSFLGDYKIDNNNNKESYSDICRAKTGSLPEMGHPREQSFTERSQVQVEFKPKRQVKRLTLCSSESIYDVDAYQLEILTKICTPSSQSFTKGRHVEVCGREQTQTLPRPDSSPV
jgi:hypothetical protein